MSEANLPVSDEAKVLSNARETITALMAQHDVLKDQITKYAKANKDLVLNNSLTDLVHQSELMSNLTSLTPILQNNVYYPLTLNYLIPMYLYKTHGIIQTAIDMPVMDAFRGGLELVSKQVSIEDLEDFMEFLEEKSVIPAIRDTMIWARLFGGGGLVVNAGQRSEAPLDWNRLRPDRLAFYDAARWELVAPLRDSPSYNFYGQDIHSTRVLLINGKRAPWLIRAQLAGWGMSEIERMIEDLNLYHRTRNVLYEILNEAKLDIFRLEGLTGTLATPDGTQSVTQRVQLNNQMKNFQKALILDKNDEYEQKQLTFSGLSDIMEHNQAFIASALQMPKSKIFGTGSQGFSSGEDDLENYNSMVESQVREPVRPLIKGALKIAARAFFNMDVRIDFKFQPLRELSRVDQEQIKTATTGRVLQMYDRGLLTSEEVGKEARAQKLLAIETKMERGELEEHPMPGGEMGMPGAGGGSGADGDGEKPPGDGWERGPKGGWRKRLPSGEYDYHYGRSEEK